MRSISTAFATEKNKLANRPIRIYKIYDYDGIGGELRFAEYDADITFNSQVYTAFPIRIDSVGENSTGEIESVRVSISNVSQFIQAKLEVYDLRGKKVSIYTGMIGMFNVADVIEEIFYIDSYGANVETADFILTGKFDVMSLELPARKFWRNYCSWKFKSTQCGYGGAETTCNKTFLRCTELNNKQRFGGFPSIPSRQIWVT